ncbi:MAG: hypothetical protein OEW11_04520 [Nitrospirota bacterium]|nr:hypothetical protein [Nitrospirota bacterium]
MDACYGTVRAGSGGWLGKVIIFALGLTGTLLPGLAAASNSFLVAPGRVDIDLARPITQVFILTNNGDSPIRLTVEPIYFEVNSSSLHAGEPIYPEKTGQDSLVDFLRVSPRTVSLQPGERRNIRASVRMPPDAPEGEYRAHLLVKMLEDATSMTPGGATSGISMILNIKMETAVAIYAHRGTRAGAVEFPSCQLNADGLLVLKGINNTPWRYEGTVRGFVQRVDAGGKGVKPVADSPPLFGQPFLLLRETTNPVVIRDFQPPHKTPLRLEWQPGPMGGAPGSTTCTPAH